MKILKSYKDMMKEFINEAEVDDDKIIKYKKKDGEQGEMKASSAKTMEKDHPAKIAWDDMQSDDSDEKEKGKDLGAGDFERPGTEKPSGGDTGKDADSGQEPKSEPEDKPFEPKTSPEGKASRQAVGDTKQGAVQSGMAKKSAEKELKVAEQGVEDAGMFGKGKAKKALASAQEKVTSTTSADDAAQAEYQKAKGAQDVRQKGINSGKVDPETHEEAQLSVDDAQKSRDDVGRSAKGFQRSGGWGDSDENEAEEQRHQDNMKRADQEVEKRKKKLEPFAKMKSRYVARTGNELNQETLTIDGKQFRRISESKKPNLRVLKENYNRIFGEK